MTVWRNQKLSISSSGKFLYKKDFCMNFLYTEDSERNNLWGQNGNDFLPNISQLNTGGYEVHKLCHETIPSLRALVWWHSLDEFVVPESLAKSYFLKRVLICHSFIHSFCISLNQSAGQSVRQSVASLVHQYVCVEQILMTFIPWSICCMTFFEITITVGEVAV